MRIISGKHRGRVLCEFKGDAVRPTSDRAREALFNILQLTIRGATFLDLFCGSGAVGIEALSRGATSAVFIDKAKESVSLAEKNLKTVGENARVICADALDYVEHTADKFDIVFLDPPYKFDATKVLCALARIITDNGIIVYEHDENCAPNSDKLECFDTRRYGKAIFDFFKVKK